MIAITLYKWGDIYAFKRYVPRIATLRSMKKQDPQLIDETAWVYGFKSAMKRAEEIELYVRAAAARFACERICAVPPSSVDDQPNSLQKLFGSSILRMHSAETRKYNHKKDLPEGYTDSYHFQGLDGAKSILLIDDVVTTGRTILHFRDALVARGYQVTPLCLGVNYRAPYQLADPLICVTMAVAGESRTDMKKHMGSLLDVLEYLINNGWKVSKSTLYQHQSEGKIRPTRNGTYEIQDVNKYACLFLRKLDGGGTDSDRLQQEKINAEARKLRAQAEHWELKARIASGQYVPKELFERELAARAAVLRSDIENFIRAEASGMISLAGGDPKKTPDLVEHMLTRVEDWLGRYAEGCQFEAPLQTPESDEHEELEEDE